jgi:hypothetical protein
LVLDGPSAAGKFCGLSDGPEGQLVYQLLVVTVYDVFDRANNHKLAVTVDPDIAWKKSAFIRSIESIDTWIY